MYRTIVRPVVCGGKTWALTEMEKSSEHIRKKNINKNLSTIERDNCELSDTYKAQAECKN